MTCEYCGETVHPDAKGRARRFCNRKCVALWREARKSPPPPPEKRECACGCGTEIDSESWWREKRYALGHNSSPRNTKTRTCEACEEKYPARRRGLRFCSKACSSGTRRVEHNVERRSGAYRRWRESVLQRDNYTCTGCDSTENLHVHHIYEFAEHPDLRLIVENGVTLCVHCHSWVHGRRLHPSVTLGSHTPHRRIPTPA